jgi:hypothetical protein
LPKREDEILGGENSMSARPVLYCLWALVFIVGCSGNGTTGPSRDAAADPGAIGGNAGGASASLSTTGVAGGAAAGATTALGGAGTAGRSGTGGTTATTTTNTGGGVGTGGGTGSGSRTGGATGGAGGLGGVTQGGASGSNTVDAAVDDGGTDGADADQGDADLKARYTACRESKNETTCSERGGTWRMDMNNINGTCVCPTGEGGRPCTASSDCLGDCSVWMDPMQGSGTWCQKYATAYTCSAEGGKQGCRCRPEPPFAVCYP